MDEEGILIGLSQLGAVFAGFIAIFTAFVQKNRRFSSAESVRIRSMLYASSIVVVASLVPLLLSMYGVPRPALWRLSAALTLMLGLPATFDVARHNLALEKQNRMQLGRVHSWVTWGLCGAVVALLGATVMGYGAGGHYVLSLLLGIAIALLNFVTSALFKLL
jgi:uncharacterized membrane protein